MIDLYDDATNQLIGSMTEADLQVLVDALEEESLDDHDYYITPRRSTSSPTAERPSTW